MSTLRDTVVHNTLTVIDNIVLTDYKYNAAKGSYGLIEYGQSDVDTKIYGKTLTLSATNFSLVTTGYQSFDAGTYTTIKTGTYLTITPTTTMTVNVGTNYTVTVGGNQNITVTGTDTETYSSNRTINTTGNHTETIGGNYSNIVTGTYTARSTGAMTISSSGAALTLTGYTYLYLNSSNNNIRLRAGAAIDAEANTSVSITGNGGIVSLINNYESTTNGYVNIISNSAHINITAATYTLLNSIVRVANSNYGTAAPTADTTGSYTGQIYFRIVS